MASGAAAGEAIATVMDGRAHRRLSPGGGRGPSEDGSPMSRARKFWAPTRCPPASVVSPPATCCPPRRCRQPCSGGLSPVMSRILPNAFSRLLKRGSRLVVRKGRRIRRRFLSPMNRAGHLSIFALTGPKRARAGSADALGRRIEPQMDAYSPAGSQSRRRAKLRCARRRIARHEVDTGTCHAKSKNADRR